jgi:cytochrome c oxidase cbb3-type subunit 1
MSNENNSPPAPPVIDASGRLPVLLLLGSALLWLVVASGFGLLASLNFHQPSLLADCPFFTYGHRASAAWAAMLFGFGGNAVLGITLWMFARLRGAKLQRPNVAALGGALWNLGVTAAVVGLIMGDGTGHEGVDLPVYAIRILLLGGALMAVTVGLTSLAGRSEEFYVSTWHLVGGLMVLPLALVMVYLLLGEMPVRGVAQATVASWAVNSLTQVWLGMVGLAIIYYFVPKILDCPLYSRQLAGVGFFSILLLGGFLGVHAGAPVPLWVVRLSTLAAVLFALPLGAVWFNIRRTIGIRAFATSHDLTLAFVGVAWWSFLAAGVATVLHPWINAHTHFTLFTVAVRQLFVFGFLGMAALGAIHYIVPRLVGADWECPKCFRRAFFCATAGLLLYVAPMLYGGIAQGGVMNDAGQAYTNLPTTALMALRVAFLGELLMLLAAVMVLAAFLRQIAMHACDCCNPSEFIQMIKTAREEGGVE